MTEQYSPAGQRRQQAPAIPGADAIPASSGPKPAPTHLNGDKSSPDTSHLDIPPSIRSVRIEATQRERRRRGDGVASGLKLAVPEHLKEPGFEHRWINEDGRRIHDKTVMDDWDIVTTQAIEGQGEGTPIKRLVGKQEGGAPLYAYLCRKPTEFYQADKRKELQVIKEREDAMKRGAPPAPEGLSGPSVYIPDRHDGMSTDRPGANRIG